MKKILKNFTFKKYLFTLGLLLMSISITACGSSNDAEIDTSEADVDIKIKGFDGYGKAVIENENYPKIEGLKIIEKDEGISNDFVLEKIAAEVSLDKEEGLSNGDEIIANISFTNPSELKIGFTDDVVEKKIEVKKLPKLINSIDDLNGDVLDRMKNDAYETINNYYREADPNEDLYEGNKLNIESKRISTLEKKLDEDQIEEKIKNDNQHSYNLAYIFEISYDLVAETDYDKQKSRYVAKKTKPVKQYIAFVYDDIKENNGGIVYLTKEKYSEKDKDEVINKLKYDGFSIIDDNKESDDSKDSNNDEDSKKSDDNSN